MKFKDKDYYLGLDIGTDSIGWAVTDENYEIMKAKGKALWGIRLFEGAQTAVERRTNRASRRRLQRRNHRIKLLQEIFAEEISKIDAGFFIRLRESKLLEEDKSIANLHTIFNDKGYTDIEYYREYPTIYHLRKELIDSKEKKDLRVIYIALHHIMKHRGHFIFEGDISNATSFQTVYDKFINIMQEELELKFKCNDIEELSNALRNKKLGVNDKKKRLVSLFDIDKKNKQMVEIVSLLSGGTGKLAELFDDVSMKELEKNKVSFQDASYEEVYNCIEESYPDRCYVLEALKAIYDWTLLADLLKDESIEGGVSPYLSYAKVNKYNKHHNDLKLLKEVVKEIGQQEHRDMFESAEVKNNYCAYIGTTKVNNKKTSVKRCKKDELYTYIKSLLKKNETLFSQRGAKDKVDYILEEISKESFLPLQTDKNNGVIPHQVHESELQQILINAAKHYNWFNEKDDNGLSISDKINKIFKFKVPYYVGPLNDYHKDKGGNSWIVKLKNEPIRPWNFEEVVDIDSSAKEFILRMTNKCTYILGEDVLPKNSLIYSEFEVLNEINNVKVAGEKLGSEIKEKILNGLFKKEKTVTRKKLYNCLKAEGYELSIEEITGIEDKFNSSMGGYIDFRKKVFLDKMEQYEYQKISEQIIRYITLYGEDKKILTRVIKKEFGDKITDEELKAIRNLRYTGWGRLSKKLLTDIEGICYETGEVFSIIAGLRKTTDNFMQLLSSTYSFGEVIEKEQKLICNDSTEITYDNLVKDIPLSPSIKRVTWQTIQIVEELKKVIGKEPKKIFIEVAKGPQEKVRTMSRKNQLISLYDKCKEESRQWKDELENKKEDDFRSIKLYLYYTQKGKCMYTGKDIALSELANVNIYDKDHIYPRSKTKDDSIDNLVLVDKSVNANKNNDVVSPEIQHKMSPYWKSLLKAGFISQEKYNRLTRTTPLSAEELAGFINRQLVETRQSTKTIARIMGNINPNSKIVYVKAKLVSEFRQTQLKVIKSRIINDLHHAKDAYLNIVVGNVYNTKFTSNPLQWIKKNSDRNYSLNKLFENDVIANENIAWKKGNKGTKEVVLRNYSKNNILYTRYATCNKGQLFDQQIVSPKANPSIPIKKGMDISKYGGYKSKTPAYFALIEYEDNKGNKLRNIESIPLYMEKEFIRETDKLITYCEEVYGLLKPRIIIPRIKKNSLFKINGFLMHLRGTTKKQLILQGAVQNIVSKDKEEYIKRIENYLARNLERTDKKTNLLLSEHDKITKEDNLRLYEYLINKHDTTIYKYRPANAVNTLVKGKEKFEEISLEEQCIVIGQILCLFTCKPISADLKLVGGSANSGVINKNKKISSENSAYMINQSVTGLYEQVIDLLTI